jgi:hypothetical protein
MLKFIFEIVAANVISKAITAPTQQQLDAEQEREWQIEKERLLRAKSDSLISDLIRDKGYTPEQIVAAHRMADEEVNKVLLADRQSIAYVSPASNNAGDIVGRFVGGFVIGIILLIVFVAIFANVSDDKTTATKAPAKSATHQSVFPDVSEQDRAKGDAKLRQGPTSPESMAKANCMALTYGQKNARPC